MIKRYEIGPRRKKNGSEEPSPAPRSRQPFAGAELTRE
jgi:hypothetical protein